MIEERMLRKEPSKITLICDIVEQRGLPLLKSFVVSHGTCTDHIVMLLLDSKPSDYPNVAERQTTFIKMVNDPLCWLSGEAENPLHELKKAIEPVKDRRVTVVIDSLTSLVLLRSMPYTCCLLHKVVSLGKDVELVGVVHEDCHEVETLALLKNCATTIFHLQPPSNPPAVTVAYIHKKNSGKIQKKREQYWLNEHYQLTETRELSSMVEQLQQAMQSVTLPPDPTANLTFNLGLSAKEKADRERVPLPYMHHTKSDKPSAKIFYQPDEADDFDEEDPDDDLDI